MKEAELKMAEDLCGCGGDPLSQETTPLEAWNFEVPVYNEQPAMSFVIPKAEVVKVRMETGSAFLDFPVNQTVIYPDYRRNDSELAKIRATIDLVKTIQTPASPTSASMVTRHPKAATRTMYGWHKDARKL